jgi:hypothetical protein
VVLIDCKRMAIVYGRKRDQFIVWANAGRLIRDQAERKAVRALSRARLSAERADTRPLLLSIAPLDILPFDIA